MIKSIVLLLMVRPSNNRASEGLFHKQRGECLAPQPPRVATIHVVRAIKVQLFHS